jgi:ABC-type bacteriocin/lantibiotic exporter with double-glycine peptidase domain
MVNNLPLGIKTLVGERGVRVSGGQKQRISLARAFYHGREVLVMDESTSALDTGTEQEIVEEIQRLKGEKTMIVIAHRLTTLQHCNAIYRLDGGRLSKKLTYNELIDE